MLSGIRISFPSDWSQKQRREYHTRIKGVWGGIRPEVVPTYSEDGQPEDDLQARMRELQSRFEEERRCLSSRIEILEQSEADDLPEKVSSLEFNLKRLEQLFNDEKSTSRFYYLTHRCESCGTRMVVLKKRNRLAYCTHDNCTRTSTSHPSGTSSSWPNMESEA